MQMICVQPASFPGLSANADYVKYFDRQCQAVCRKCLKELCFLGFFPDLQTFLSTYFSKHWIDIYSAWTFPDHFPCIMLFTQVCYLLSLGSFVISMINFNSLEISMSVFFQEGIYRGRKSDVCQIWGLTFLSSTDFSSDLLVKKIGISCFFGVIFRLSGLNLKFVT